MAKIDAVGYAAGRMILPKIDFLQDVDNPTPGPKYLRGAV
jgi:hypothetical protein